MKNNVSRIISVVGARGNFIEISAIIGVIEEFNKRPRTSEKDKLQRYIGYP